MGIQCGIQSGEGRPESFHMGTVCSVAATETEKGCQIMNSILACVYLGDFFFFNPVLYFIDEYILEHSLRVWSVVGKAWEQMWSQWGKKCLLLHSWLDQEAELISTLEMK